MAQIKLTVDTSQAKSALQDINNTITQLKVNGSNVEIGGKKIDAQLVDITKEANEAANAVSNIHNESVKGSNKALNALKGFTAASKQALGAAKVFAQGLFNVWTGVIVAVELAAQAFKYFFVNLTQSIPKVIAKSQNLVNITQKQVERFEKERKTTNDLKNTLGELAEKESLTSSEQLYAQAIIDKLSERYKGLKLSIDSATGAIVGYNDAVDKMNQKDRQQELKLAKRQISAQRQAVNAQLANTFGTGNVSLDRSASNRDFWTFAENQFGDLSQMDRERITKRFNNGNLYDKKAVLEDLATVYNNNQQILTKINAAIDAVDNLIKAQQNYNELTNAASLIIKSGNQQLQDNKQLHGQIVSLQEQSKKSEEDLAKARRDAAYDALETDQQRADFIKKELEQLDKQAEQAQRDIQSANDQLSHNTQMVDYSTGQTDSFKKDIDERNAKVTELRKNIQQISKDLKKQTGKELDKNALGVDYRKELESRLSFLQNTIDSGESYKKYRASDSVYAERDAIRAELNAISKTLELTKEISRVEGQRDALIERMNEHLAVGREAETARLQAQKKSEQLQATQAQRTLEIEQKKLQLAQLEKAIKDQQARQQQALQDVYANYENQLQAYNKSARQIAIETALANAQKAKGAELTQEQIDQIKVYVNQLEDMKKLEEERAKKKREAEAIEGVFANYDERQAIAYLKLVGKQKEAIMLEARLNAEKAKGAALTEEELKSLQDYINTQLMLQDASGGSKAQLMTGGVIADQLARKGGDLSSVVMDRAQDVNKQILAEQIKQTDLTSKLNSSMQKNNTLIEKYAVIQ